jgi:predicted Holliday junction resolvase-like endonuclease
MKSVVKEWGIDLGDGGFGPQMLGSAILLQGWNMDPPESNSNANSDSKLNAREEMRARWMRKRSKKRKEDEEDGRTEEEREEDERKELEMMRKLKETAKRFLENYEMIPKELIFLGRSMEIIQSNNRVSPFSFSVIVFVSPGC